MQCPYNIDTYCHLKRFLLDCSKAYTSLHQLCMKQQYSMNYKITLLNFCAFLPPFCSCPNVIFQPHSNLDIYFGNSILQRNSIVVSVQYIHMYLFLGSINSCEKIVYLKLLQNESYKTCRKINLIQNNKQIYNSKLK